LTVEKYFNIYFGESFLTSTLREVQNVPEVNTRYRGLCQTLRKYRDLSQNGKIVKPLLRFYELLVLIHVLDQLLEVNRALKLEDLLSSVVLLKSQVINIDYTYEDSHDNESTKEIVYLSDTLIHRIYTVNPCRKMLYYRKSIFEVLSIQMIFEYEPETEYYKYWDIMYGIESFQRLPNIALRKVLIFLEVCKYTPEQILVYVQNLVVSSRITYNSVFDFDPLDQVLRDHMQLLYRVRLNSLIGIYEIRSSIDLILNELYLFLKVQYDFEEIQNIALLEGFSTPGNYKSTLINTEKLKHGGDAIDLHHKSSVTSSDIILLSQSIKAEIPVLEIVNQQTTSINVHYKRYIIQKQYDSIAVETIKSEILNILLETLDHGVFRYLVMKMTIFKYFELPA